jgi:hypothetical protein
MKALIGVVMMCVAGGVAAEGVDANIANCKSIAGLSRAIMTSHQSGVPIDTVIEKTMEIEPNYIDLVLAIYGTTRFSSKEYQDKAIRNAYNDTFIGCMKGIK